VPGANTAELIPFCEVAVGAQQTLRRITPELVTGDPANETSVKTSAVEIDLCAELAAERHGQRAFGIIVGFIAERAAESGKFAVHPSTAWTQLCDGGALVAMSALRAAPGGRMMPAMAPQIASDGSCNFMNFAASFFA
jgi:hypothetical protein